MTSLSMLLWISSAILLQLAVYLGISFFRHWRNFEALRDRAVEFNLPGVESIHDEDKALALAWSGHRTFRVERKVTEDATKQICSFYLVPQDGQPLPDFHPGQFLTFRLDLPAEGGTQQLVRCYSLSDAPNPRYYRVSIKRALPAAGYAALPGRSSSYFHDHIAVGSLLQVRAPAGHFYVAKSLAPIVLIGGGIGITPMLSMLNWCLTAQTGREVWLFYGVRDSREVVMRTHLEALAATHANFHLWLCLSNPLPDDQVGSTPWQAGRITIEMLRLKLPLKPYHFYICGPNPLMESLVPALEEWGVPDTHIHFEAFGPASVKRKTALATMPSPSGTESAASNILVTFSQSGKELRWQPEHSSLLDFAQANGVSVSSGCRVGGCGSCQTTIRAGEVSYSQAPDYDPEPGTCLLCVCTPKTSVTLEA